MSILLELYTTEAHLLALAVSYSLDTRSSCMAEGYWAKSLPLLLSFLFADQPPFPSVWCISDNIQVSYHECTVGRQEVREDEGLKRPFT